MPMPMAGTVALFISVYLRSPAGVVPSDIPALHLETSRAL
jgi:hypothetical protein